MSGDTERMPERTGHPQQDVSVKQAAQIAGLSEKMIRRAIKRDLRAYDCSLSPGRATWRIDLIDLEAWRKRKPAKPFQEPKPAYHPVKRPASDWRAILGL